MWLFKLVLVAAAIYLAILALMYGMQTQMLFPTRLAALPGLPLPDSAQRLEVATPDGEVLRGVRIPPTRDRAGPREVILGFGGNAWNADDLASYLAELFPDSEIVAVHYRGYAPSTGRPSAAALQADAPIVFDHVGATVGTTDIVAVGFSIGASVAAHLATRRRLAGLILVSPFDSLEALARDHYPWAPVGLLLRHRMSTRDAVDGLTIPIALLTAEDDTIVPPRRTDAVRRAISALVFDRTIDDADHNDLAHRPDFRAAMIEALSRIRSARPGPASSTSSTALRR